ncbi:MAG: sugar phosphate isomerase/epimerase [Planctomycetes bacterium]|nr:sugar phosphate isomerase/epimerase [Planctomycetota bacterium]
MSDFALCLNTSTIRPTGLMEKIAIAGECGYDAIELWINDIDEAIEQGGSIDDVKKALADNNLSVPTIIALHGWLGSTGAEHQKAVDEAGRRLDIGEQLGAQYAISSPPRAEVDLDKGGAQYRELMDLADGLSIKPSMEFLGFVPTVCTIKAAWKIVCDADHPDGSIIMDPFHVFRGGGSIDEMDPIPGDKIAVFHFNDAVDTKPRAEQSDADRVFPGDGVLDLADMIRRLKQKRYSGAISLELFNPTYWEQDPKEVCRVGLEKMRAVVESV